MKNLVKLYQRSSWYLVYNDLTTGGRARTSLLFAVMMQAVVNGFTGGIFYTGLLVGYGINIVNISILTIVPCICSVFSLLSPVILSRFPRRRMLMTVTRILFYVVNIIGITLLPQVVQSETGRVVGLVAVVFLANAINFLFSPGYSPWHMTYLTPNVRSSYISSTTLVSQIVGGLILIVASILTDRIAGAAQLDLIIVLRWVAFGVALLDVYFLQKPVEPEYQVTTNRMSLGKSLLIPLHNRKFMLTMSVYALHLFSVNMVGSVINTWLLEEVHTSFLYINVINALYMVAIPLTTPLWRNHMLRHGTFTTLAIATLLNAPTCLLYGLVNHGNYLWLMTFVRLAQHAIGMGLALTVNNLIYINLPQTDQDSYIALYTIIGNGTNFVAMSVGTWIVAVLGAGTVSLLGLRLTSVPLLLILQGLVGLASVLYILYLRAHADPDFRHRHEKQA